MAALLDPSQNPEGIGGTVGDRRRMTDAQRLQTLLAQVNDPARDPGSTPELQAEIARLQKGTAGGQTVMFEGKPHQFPADATEDEISQALSQMYPAPPAASQADVRATEPKLSPMQTQDERQAAFDKATKDYISQTGGNIPAGKNIRQAVSAWSGVADPMDTANQAQMDELKAGGDLRYGDSVPYAAAKAAAATFGFMRGGPTAATGMETLVRQAALAYNLTRAVDAGAIDFDRAAEIFTKESMTGGAQDAAFNFGLPILAQIAKRVPGTQWLYDKVAALVSKQFGGGMSTAAQDATAQRTRAVDKLAASAPTPAAQDAVQQLGQRTQGVIPTPGQVTGEASAAEQGARVIDPAKFDRANTQLAGAAEDMRQDLVNPAAQPSRQALGETITKTAEDLQKAVKTRLRPTFEAADNLGVKVDFDPVLAEAKASLAKDVAVPGGRLSPQERSNLANLVSQLEGSTGSGLSAKSQVSPEAALDFISRQKETLRASPDYKPSSYYETIVNRLNKAADGAYADAAARAGKPEVAQNLMKAQADYRDMMSTVYDDAVKQALRKNPEDVGRLFWQAGNVSEIQQLHKMLDMATKEGAMTGTASTKLRGDMVRGFLAEALPDAGAAAKWSDTLSAKPGLRDTWLTLTATPGGSELRGAMEVLEQASKIALREHKDLMGSLGLAAIPISRAAGGGVGLSLVTGVFHPGIAAVGLSVDVLGRMMATAYTQGNKGVLNATMRALRANSAGTAASAKILQETLPALQKYAQDNQLGDLYVQAAEMARDAAVQQQ